MGGRERKSAKITEGMSKIMKDNRRPRMLFDAGSPDNEECAFRSDAPSTGRLRSPPFTDVMHVPPPRRARLYPRILMVAKERPKRKERYIREKTT